jgi:hypothetical protein
VPPGFDKPDSQYRPTNQLSVLGELT